MIGPHDKGDTILGRYQISRYIDAGGMQYVYAARDTKLNRDVALKTPKSESLSRRFQNSAVLAAKINHHNVAKTFDYFVDSDRPYLIEEYVDGVDLDKMFRAKAKYIDPYLSARLFHYMAKGLAASHHAGVVHRDIKPSNILFINRQDKIELKITDFGIAKMAAEELIEAAEGDDVTLTNSQTAIGALPYMAPEVINTPRDVDKAADIWSVGALLFKLMTGEFPFGSGLKAVAKIQAAKFPTVPSFVIQNPQYQQLSEQLIGIMKECMSPSPSDRMNADELVSECEKLCYPITSRFTGHIKLIKYKAWGFITTEGNDVFFHKDSIYGGMVNEDDEVMYAKHSGGGAHRAHPVVKLKENL